MNLNKVLLIVVIALGIISFGIDTQLYYYGKNILDVYSFLPHGIKPVFRYDFEGGFAMEDAFGIYIVSRGEHRYVGSEKEINIEEIVSYGFSEEILIVEVIDNTQKIYFVNIQRKRDTRPNEDIQVDILNNLNSIQSKNIEWIQIKNNESYIKFLNLSRSCIALLFGFLCFTLLFRIFRTKHS